MEPSNKHSYLFIVFVCFLFLLFFFFWGGGGDFFGGGGGGGGQAFFPNLFVFSVKRLR